MEIRRHDFFTELLDSVMNTEYRDYTSTLWLNPGQSIYLPTYLSK